MSQERLDVSGGDSSSVWKPSYTQILADLRSDIVGYSRDSLRMSQRVIWSAEDIVMAIRSPEGIQLLESMIASDESHNRYLIELFLTSVPVNRLNSEARIALGSVLEVEEDVTILPFYRSWDLCGSSEAYLKEAMERKRTVLAGDTILLKDSGRRAGLCVQTTSTPSGTFLAGGWYQPVDQEGLDAAFRARNRRIELGGEWVHMRDISAYHISNVAQDIILNARRHAEKIK